MFVVSGFSFNGRQFLPSIKRFQAGFPSARRPQDGIVTTCLRSSTSGDLNAMTVKDLKDLLRVKGLSVTGLKKELIERLTESTSGTSRSMIEHDYLASP